MAESVPATTSGSGASGSPRPNITSFFVGVGIQTPREVAEKNIPNISDDSFFYISILNVRWTTMAESVPATTSGSGASGSPRPNNTTLIAEWIHSEGWTSTISEVFFYFLVRDP